MVKESVPAIALKPGREKSLRRRHPWIFEGAIAHVQGDPQSGETVAVTAQDGTPLGWGSYSPRSQIRVRMWTFNPAERVDAAWMAHRLQRAIAYRTTHLLDETHTACRLVAAESDGLPGVIVDRYGDTLVCQFLATGAEYWRSVLVEQLQALLPGLDIYERSDVDIRSKERLPLRSGLLAGKEPPELLSVQEGSGKFWVDVRQGHKTGFYLDQRENRAIAMQHAAGCEVLNCFSYTGGFSVAALAGGASHVLNIDGSAAALALSEKNHELNGLAGDHYTHQEGDVFQVLRQFHQERRQFDMIILDPPKFVESQASLNRAARGYKDINRLAFLLLRPGGLLFTFSCSGLMPVDLFQKIVADAALDAHREAQIIQRLTQAADHPTLLSFPESFYLKGFVCRVLDDLQS